MYVAGEAAVRQGIAELRAKIERERAFAIERVERLRRFARDEALEHREREEWRAFHDRTRIMEQEIQVMVSALAQVEAFRQPPPVIIPLPE